jgi:hypothetical protein
MENWKVLVLTVWATAPPPIKHQAASSEQMLGFDIR